MGQCSTDKHASGVPHGGPTMDLRSKKAGKCTYTYNYVLCI